MHLFNLRGNNPLNYSKIHKFDTIHLINNTKTATTTHKKDYILKGYDSYMNH